MHREPPKLSDAELQRQRKSIHHGLVRANSAALIIIGVVVALALVAILQAYRAETERHRAELAERDARKKLQGSYFEQAKAIRLSGLAQRRFQGLEAITAAAKIQRTLEPGAEENARRELRNEAIATLALAGLKVHREWRIVANWVFDADLERYAVCRPDNSVEVRRTDDDGLVSTITLDHRPVRYPAFALSGHGLLLRFERGGVQLWDIGSPKASLRAEWDGPRGVLAGVDLSPAGTLMALDSDSGNLKLIDLEANRELARLNLKERPQNFCLHPRDALIAAHFGNELEVWNWQTGRRLYHRTFSVTLTSMAWRPDGKLLAVGGVDQQIYVCSQRLDPVRVLQGHEALVTRVFFNPQGDWLLSTAFDGTTRVWDPLAGRQVLVSRDGYGSAFSRDGRRLAFERPKVAVGFWDVNPGVGFRTYPLADLGEVMHGVDFSPDGRLMAASGSEGFWLWSLQTDQEIAFQSLTEAQSIAFHPRGDALVTCSREGLFAWPVESDPASARAPRIGQRRRLDLPAGSNPEHAVFSDDGQQLVVDGGDVFVYVLDWPTGRLRTRIQPHIRPHSVAISPDKKWLATGTWHSDGTQIWEAQSGNLVTNLAGRSAEVAFSRDGDRLLVGTSDEYTLRAVGTWRPVQRLERDTIGELTGPISFSRDGSLLALAPTHRTARLVDPVSLREITTLTAPQTHLVRALSFNADGSRLAVATSAGAVQVWDLRALHTALTALGLDWQVESSSPASRAALAGLAEAPGRSEFTGLLTLTASGAVVLALLLALFVLRWHRGLSREYFFLEHLAEERNRKLELVQGELFHGQKMRALGTLAAGIAHDFNNLLSVIRMANKLTGRSVSDNPDVQENVQLVEKAVAQGKQVVNSMLGYSRTRSDRQGPFSVADMVESDVALLSKQFLGRVALTLELDRSAPPVSCAQGRLEQILLNLVVNASEAMKGDGKLLIAVRPRADLDAVYALRPRPAPRYVQLIVADSGPGIPPEILPRIFEPFFSTKDAGTTRGTGLGLSMVYTLAQQDGLGISAESAPGKGAAFRITIPAD
jgi:signal transduction histidine kinase